MRTFVLALVLLLSAPLVSASGMPEPRRIDDIPTFLAQQRDIADAIENAKKFRHVSNSQRDRLAKAQDTLLTLLEGRSSIDELDADERVRLYNAQEEVNAVLTDADLDRPICQRRKPVGSHRPILECYTRRERDEAATAARQSRLKTRACSGPECIGN